MAYFLNYIKPVYYHLSSNIFALRYCVFRENRSAATRIRLGQNYRAHTVIYTLFVTNLPGIQHVLLTTRPVTKIEVYNYKKNWKNSLIEWEEEHKILSFDEKIEKKQRHIQIQTYRYRLSNTECYHKHGILNQHTLYNRHGCRLSKRLWCFDRRLVADKWNKTDFRFCALVFSGRTQYRVKNNDSNESIESIILETRLVHTLRFSKKT